VLEYARLHIRIPIGEEERLVKSVRINDRFCQVSFEEEIPPVSTFGTFFHKWSVTSEEGSEAHLDTNVGEYFFEYECSEHYGRNRERRGEEKIVQFSAEGEEYPKGGTRISGGINSIGKSQSDALELRKDGTIELENEVERTSKSS